MEGVFRSPARRMVFPTSSRRHAIRVLLGLVLAGLLAATGPIPAARAELIYDNSQNDLGTFLAEAGEFGDEVDFAGTARTVTEISFVYVAERDVDPATRAIIRIYANDGPPLPTRPPVPTPGTLLFQSTEFPVDAGVWPIRIIDIAVPVPNRVTWTIEFTGAGNQPGERAGLQVFHPPLVGRSFRDYWVRGVNGFNLFLLESGQPASFAARFHAIPDPPILLTVTPGAGTSLDLLLSGPIGSELIVERSGDLLRWSPIGLASLATNATARFTDTTAPVGEDRHYRARPAPHPGQTAILTSIQPHPEGGTTLTLVGSRQSEHVLEVSIDQRSWQTLDLLRFADGPVTYRDTLASLSEQRLYRTRRPLDARHLHRIRTVRPESNGAVTVVCTTPTGTGSATVEASTNLKDWVEVGKVTFTAPDTAFIDPQGAQGPARFYRLHAP